MRTLHVTTSLKAQASGSTYAVLALCRSLAASGVDVEVAACEGATPDGSPFSVRSHGFWNWPPRLGISPGLRRAVHDRSVQTDIIHSHGVWNMSSPYADRAARRNGKAHIISLHGSLSPRAINAGSSWKKAAAWKVFQRRVLKNASCMHVTCDAECDDLRCLGLHIPATVIPIGVDIPEAQKTNAQCEPSSRRLLFMSRITPIKGIATLLKAWVIVQRDFREWNLHITGVDDRGHEKAMKTLAAEIHAERVRFTGPVYGARKTNALFDADLFVLPTHSENFGVVVAEALAHGLPAIVTKGAPWEGLGQHACGWWIDIGVEPLVECLRDALAESSKALRERGRRGRAWVQRDFCWTEVARKMLKTYEWILGGGAPPEWVSWN